MSFPTFNIDNRSISPEVKSLLDQIDDLFPGAQVPATVFPKFDELAGELISYYRISIGIYVDSWSQIEIAYAAGAPLSTYTTGHRAHIQFDDMEIWASKRQPLTNLTVDSGSDQQLTQESDLEAQKHGFRSWMLIPIRWNDELKGDLLFRSFDDNTYQQREIDLAGVLAVNIAETVASAQANSEAMLESNIRKDLLELSRLVSSVQSIQDVESDFGDIILSITNSDRATVSLPGSSGTFAENILVFGDPIPKLGPRGHNPPLGSDKISWLQAETAYLVVLPIEVVYM